MNDNVWQQKNERNCTAVRCENKMNEAEDCVKQGCIRKGSDHVNFFSWRMKCQVYVHTAVQIAAATQQQVYGQQQLEEKFSQREEGEAHSNANKKMQQHEVFVEEMKGNGQQQM